MKCFRTYAFTSNPLNIPLAWPSIVIHAYNGFNIATDIPPHLPQDLNWNLVSDEDYQAYLDLHFPDYQSWKMSYDNGVNSVGTVNAVVDRAIVFGNDLLKEFATENILLGITQMGMTNSVRKNLFQVSDACTKGSLKDAITEIRNIPQANYDSTFITAPRLLKYLNKIEDYLGMVRSTSL